MGNRHKNAKVNINSDGELVEIVKVKPSNAKSKFWDGYNQLGVLQRKVLGIIKHNISNLASFG